MSTAEANGYTGRILRRPPTSAPPSSASRAPVTQQPSVAVYAEAESARREAEQALARATENARQILDAARAEASEILAKARNDADAAVMAKMLQTSEEFRREVDRLAPLLANLITDAVRKIIGHIPEPDLLRALVKRSIDELSGAVGVKMATSSFDHDTLTRVVNDLRAEIHVPVERIEIDPKLSQGTFRLSAAGVTHEFGIESQLTVLTDLLQIRHRRPFLAR